MSHLYNRTELKQVEKNGLLRQIWNMTKVDTCYVKFSHLNAKIEKQYQYIMHAVDLALVQTVLFGDEFISVEVRKVDDDPFEKKCEYS
ncbi:hypothetical protein F442_07222, partial [Phytophthora nicotianae P10297]